MNYAPLADFLFEVFNFISVCLTDCDTQLTAEHASDQGRQALDQLLYVMEANIGKLVVVFAGYEEELESVLAHNPGFASRIRYTFQFDDFSNETLHRILVRKIETVYKGNMKVEGGFDGKYLWAAIRKLGRGRGKHGFGNARAVHTLFQDICGRQARRLEDLPEYMGENGPSSDIFLLTRDDILGHPPPLTVPDTPEWRELKKMPGIDQVKDAVRNIYHSIGQNYLRDIKSEPPLNIPLRYVFLGPPGTGKTTVVDLFARILAHANLVRTQQGRLSLSLFGNINRS